MINFNLIIEANNFLLERRTGGGMGSVEGRSQVTKGLFARKKVNPMKSRVKVYGSISDALKHGYYGQIFSTKGARRLYVVTHHKWGKDPAQRFGNRTAKGFTPGSAPSSFADVKKYAVRTQQRYAGLKSKRLQQKYGPK